MDVLHSQHYDEFFANKRLDKILLLKQVLEDGV